MDLTSATWRTSTRSQGNGNCVEVSNLGHAVAVRHSMHPDDAVLIFTPAEWWAFIEGVKDHEFDFR